ncbi:MAG TPA: hypothetical protein VNY05_40370 [Candidatus Acidoferrales bacterium]|nr:hypothetical protein [Candidatus Acidoferrales bacterium]
MREDPDSVILTRRSVLALAGVGFAGGPRLCAAVVDFWNKKAPEEWSTEEIDRLLTKSPWAKEVSAPYAAGAGDSRGMPGSGRNGGGGIGIPGIGNIGMGGRGRGGRGTEGGRGGSSGYQGTVRWESAAPILAALKAPLPDGFEGRYVISVNGFPMMPSRSQTRTGEGETPDSSRRSREEEFENLKGLSSLQVTGKQAKGKELVQAGVVQQQVATTGASFLFGFSKELLPLDGDDKEVLFSTTLGNLAVKARFIPKEMLYHGQLAV